jgi:hypothetical protein
VAGVAVGTVALVALWRAWQGPGLLRAPDRGLREVAAWARTQSPADAVFLVDPRWDMFRVLAERSPFFTWKEGAALMWRQGFALDWAARLRALGGRLERTGRSLEAELDGLAGALTDARVRALAAQHGIEYWALPRERPTTFPAVFEGRAHKVVRIVR